MQEEKLPRGIRPRANEIVITCNLIEVEKEDKVIDKDEQQLLFDEFQYVLYTGSVVRDVRPGDIVSVKPDRFARYQNQKSKVREAVEGYEKVLVGYEFPIISTGQGNMMLITDQDIKYIVDGGFTTDVKYECTCGSDHDIDCCNTFSPYVATTEDLKGDFGNE